jgi:YcxB-like protein
MAEEHFLTVEYALTRREIFRSFLHSVAASPRFRNTILLYSAALFVSVLLLHMAIARSLTLEDVITAAIVSVFFIPLWTSIRGKTATRTLTVSADGISTKIGELEGQVPWNKIKVITDTPQFVLIGRTNGNAFFIPNRAFSGPEHRLRFLTEIKNWAQASAKHVEAPG